MTEIKNFISLNEWRKEKSSELESLVPKGFSGLEEFLGYCIIHSETERALFHVEHLNALYMMAGYPACDSNEKLTSNFYPLHDEDMKPIIEAIYRRKNSIEIKSERVD